MNKIRVLHIIQNLNVGGIERIAAQTAVGLDKNRFEAELWCLSGGGPLEAIFRDRINKIRIFDYKRYLLPGNIISLARRIKEGDFDIVHTHSYAPGVVGRIAARIAGVKAIVHHHHSVAAEIMTPRRNFSERLVTRYFTSRVIACSNAVREYIIANRFADERQITVIYNGVPAEFETHSGAGETLKQRLGIKSERVIAAVGSLAVHKGHIFLLEAFKEIVMTVPDARLLIAGEGPERPKLELFINDNMLSGKVMLLGNLSDIRPLLEIAEVFVLPSIIESMSISCAEAMSKYLPVAASRTGGVSEVVKDGETGILFKPADTAGIEKAVLRLLGDRNSAAAMGKKGFDRYIKYFSAGTMIERLQNIYIEIYN